MQIFTVRKDENSTLLNSDDNQLVAVSPAQAAWLSRWLKIERVLSAGGPRMMTQILELGKSRVTRSKHFSFCLIPMKCRKLNFLPLISLQFEFKSAANF